MAGGVVTVGRHKYAVGLYWENSPGSGRVAQIAKEAANQPGQQADFFAVRPGNKNGRIPQFGLATAEAGQAGMPVLAACLATQIPGSWAGAFRLNEGVVVIIVRDDLIVPDGDLFFPDEPEARDRLVQEIGFGGLHNIYAPESWAIPSADTVPLSLLLNDRRDIKLQPVNIPQKLKLMIGVAVLGFIIILGGFWYWQQQANEQDSARAAREDAMRRAQAAMKLLPSAMQSKPPPPPEYDRKWEKSPAVNDFINSCRQGLSHIPIAVAGWKMGQLKCSGTAINLAWSRERGIAVPLPSGSIINETASNATQTISLPPLQPRGPENLLDSDEITKRYLTQNWTGTLSHAADDPLPSPPPGYNGPWNPPLPPWVKRSFTLNVPELPSDLSTLIGNLPGVVINNMTYTPGGAFGSWAVEGVIYENRK